MSETIVRCPMCPNHCDVRMLRCIRGRQWQIREKRRKLTSSALKNVEVPQKTDQPSEK